METVKRSGETLQYKLIGNNDIDNVIKTVLNNRGIDNWKEYYGFVCEEELSDSYIMHFYSDNYDSIAFMILNSGIMASDVQPPELMGRITFYAKKTYDWYVGK